jgi:hypothetical protein
VSADQVQKQDTSHCPDLLAQLLWCLRRVMSNRNLSVLNSSCKQIVRTIVRSKKWVRGALYYVYNTGAFLYAVYCVAAQVALTGNIKPIHFSNGPFSTLGATFFILQWPRPFATSDVPALQTGHFLSGTLGLLRASTSSQHLKPCAIQYNTCYHYIMICSMTMISKSYDIKRFCLCYHYISNL